MTRRQLTELPLHVAQKQQQQLVLGPSPQGLKLPCPLPFDTYSARPTQFFHDWEYASRISAMGRVV